MKTKIGLTGLLFCFFFVQDAAAQTFQKDPLTGTISCAGASVGDTGKVSGVTYTAVNNAGIKDSVNTGADMSKLCTSLVTDMYMLFQNKTTFNDDISSWDVSNVTNMAGLFYNAANFNSDVSKWDVSAVKNMNSMFRQAGNFTGDLSDWDVSEVTDMGMMFRQATKFEGDLSDWKVTNVKNMSRLFQKATNFEGDLIGWDVSSVTNMSYMFADATSFDGDLSSWDVSKVTDMSNMFTGAVAFDHDIGSWDVSKVTNMSNMFDYAQSFNQDIGGWDVSAVIIMSVMFYKAQSFNQDLTGWCVQHIASEPANFSSESSLVAGNYPVWGSCPGSEFSLSGGEGWRMLSSSTPVSYGELLSPLWTQGIPGSDSPDYGQPNVYTYNTSAEDFTPLSDMEENITPGTGFIAYVFESDDYESPGSFPKAVSIDRDNLNRGEIDASGLLSPADSGWTLVGNPYPFDIKWDSLTKTGLTEVVQVYDHSIPGYLSWNGFAGGLTDGKIAAFQGFWVQNDDETEAEERKLKFTENARTTKAVLYKRTVDKKDSGTFKLTAEVDGLQSTTWFAFSEAGLASRDRGDALKLAPLDYAPHLMAASLGGDVLLDINHLPGELSGPLEVPLVIELRTHAGEGYAPADGRVSLSAAGLEQLPESWSVHLNNYHNGERVNLRETETYVFDLAAKGKVVPSGAPSSMLAPVGVAKEKASGSPWLSLTIGPAEAETEAPQLPLEFALQQNYPNPFNPATTIKYSVAQAGNVQLAIYNVMGQKVAELVNEQKTAGRYAVQWAAGEVASGVYFYRLRQNGKILTKRMTLIK